MPESSFRDYLVGALASVREEMPELHARMVAALAGREVLLDVDGEQVTVRGGDVAEPGAESGPCVRLEADKQTIVALADAELSIEDAIWRDRVRLWGGIDDLIAFHDALIVYLHGAVRAPSSPERMRRFRAFVNRRAHVTE